ncbi:unnamed protein product, partial [Amoebophrya sp. A120]|eukprot:GSA120T00023404001.1
MGERYERSGGLNEGLAQALKVKQAELKKKGNGKKEGDDKTMQLKMEIAALEQKLETTFEFKDAKGNTLKYEWVKDEGSVVQVKVFHNGELLGALSNPMNAKKAG